MVARNPLVSFFALAYGISWLLWAPLWLPAFGVTGLPVLPFHHALGALHLVEQGKLTLDGDVNTTLTSWKMPASFTRGDGVGSGSAASLRERVERGGHLGGGGGALLGLLGH